MSNIKGATSKPSQSLHLDVAQQKAFIKYYESLGRKPPTTVRFFDRSDYYSLHGEDAHLAAKSVFKSTASIKTMKPGGGCEDLDYVSLSKGNFEIFLRELLLVKNYRAEVYTNKGRSGDWSIEYKGSPGNLSQFEELLFENSEMVIGTSIIAINVKTDGNQKLIGLGCIEVNENSFSILEFYDDDFFTELEAIIVLLSPKECLLPTADGDFASIKSLMERNGVMTTIKKKTDFIIDKSELELDLKKLLHFNDGQEENANALIDFSKILALSALGSLIKYLDLIKDQTNFAHFEIVTLNLNRFVHLDTAAVAALNLLPKPGTSITSSAYKWQSLQGVLDRCKTPQGHRLIAKWLKQPLRNEELIKERHDIVEYFIDASTVREDLYEKYMKRMPDILLLSKKLMRKKANLQDIYRLYQVVVRSRQLLTSLTNVENVTVENVIVTPMKDTLNDLKVFKQMVEQVMDVDGIEKGEYFVSASFDDQLKELKKNMDTIEERIGKQLNKCIRNLNVDDGAVKLEYLSHLGYHFRMTSKDDTIIEKNKSYTVLDAIKGGIRFTHVDLQELNADFIDAKKLYETQQQTIVEEIIRVALGYLNPFTILNNQVAQLDCLLSFAVAAITAPIPYVRPKMLAEGSGFLEMKQLRHPCLELQEDIQFIANDVYFENDNTSMYIITGPNMGGKSTYIRSVGAAVLLSHIGSFVPCSEAKISIVDSILGRIGANDNIAKGLSTFMVEMIETGGIIRTATSNSLVVIDELGRGTSTYEGCGIAWAIAEYLAKKIKCFTLFATHFHEITELAKHISTVKNCHMAAIADVHNFTLLYHVRPGVMDKSFGIHVAKLANFPADVVKMAQDVYDENEDHFINLKTNDDEKLIEDSIAKLLEIDYNNPEKLLAVLRDIDEKFQSSNSNYFEAVSNSK